MTKIPNSKPLFLFWSLNIGIWDLFVIWCLEFDILRCSFGARILYFCAQSRRSQRRWTSNSTRWKRESFTILSFVRGREHPSTHSTNSFLFISSSIRSQPGGCSYRTLLINTIHVGASFACDWKQQSVENGYFSHNAREIRLWIDGAFTLDGEIYHASTEHGPVTVSNGGDIEFIRIGR